MKNGPCCGNCFYSRPGPYENLRCCFNAPAVTAVPTTRGSVAQTLWPLVEKELWCGNYKEQEERDV